jgi:predicted alpha/beta-hydrolase family hydrolase
MAWVDLDTVRGAKGLLLLGHGAGGTVDALDLLAVREAALAHNVTVARVTQPYRVLGRRAPAPIARLDEAWLAVTTGLARRRNLKGLPAVHAGRSSGARVACRCAGATEATAVVALAFPVHPPGKPEKSRIDELRAVATNLLVVQGTRDAFGQPPADLFDGVHRTLVSIGGADHSLKKDPAQVGRAVAHFLRTLY